MYLSGYRLIAILVGMLLVFLYVNKQSDPYAMRDPASMTEAERAEMEAYYDQHPRYAEARAEVRAWRERSGRTGLQLMEGGRAGGEISDSQWQMCLGQFNADACTDQSWNDHLTRQAYQGPPDDAWVDRNLTNRCNRALVGLVADIQWAASATELPRDWASRDYPPGINEPVRRHSQRVRVGRIAPGASFHLRHRLQYGDSDRPWVRCTIRWEGSAESAS